MTIARTFAGRAHRASYFSFDPQIICGTIGNRQPTCGLSRRQRQSVAQSVGLALGCLISLWVVFCPLPSIEVGQSAIARIMAGLKEWKDFLIALVAGCAITLGVVFMTRKNEAF